MTREILDRLREVFRTAEPVLVFPSSGTGAWEAALVNTLAPGERVLMYETGHFATQLARHGRAPGPRYFCSCRPIGVRASMRRRSRRRWPMIGGT